MRLAVRGLVVVRLGLVDRRALLGDGGGDRGLAGVARSGVDEAEQVRCRREHELHADALPDTLENRVRAHRELVAPMELLRDVGEVLCRPVRLAMESPQGADRAA